MHADRAACPCFSTDITNALVLIFFLKEARQQVAATGLQRPPMGAR